MLNLNKIMHKFIIHRFMQNMRNMLNFYIVMQNFCNIYIIIQIILIITKLDILIQKIIIITIIKHFMHININLDIILLK